MKKSSNSKVTIFQKPTSAGQQNRQCNKKKQTIFRNNRVHKQIVNSINNQVFLYHIYGFIFRSKEKKLKLIKTIQIKKVTKIISSRPTAASREPDSDNLQDEFVYNLSTKQIINAESLLKNGPRFALSPSPIPKVDYITVTTHICGSLVGNMILHRKLCQR